MADTGTATGIAQIGTVIVPVGHQDEALEFFFFRDHDGNSFFIVQSG
jgi:hypothetical protein